MSEQPALLFCVGATKAGTSWLYRYLHDHPQCHLRSIKELHYFDTLDFADQAHQIDTFLRLRRDLELRRAEAEGWHLQNLTRQIDDVDEMLAVLRDPEGGLDRYRAYLVAGAGGRRLVGDFTPGYALLSEARLRMMAALAPAVRFVYLMRDPLERLWSHVRMQAARQARAGEDLAQKARRILNRVTRRGLEPHIAERGDYRGAVTRLAAAVPAGCLLVEFTERVISETGLARLCGFLGIACRPADTAARWHEGMALPFPEALRAQTLAFLAPQYEFVEQTFGPLPGRWQANLVRA